MKKITPINKSLYEKTDRSSKKRIVQGPGVAMSDRAYLEIIKNLNPWYYAPDGKKQAQTTIDARRKQRLKEGNDR